MQERFVFGLRFRGEVQKTKKVAVGRMVLGADIVDEGRLVETIHDLLAILRDKVFVLLVIVCLSHDGRLLCVDELLPTPNSAINHFKVNLTRKILCGNYFGNLPFDSVMLYCPI